MNCPYCQSAHVVKKGSNSVGTPKFLCCDCKRQFVANAKKKPISNETKQVIDRLLLERISLAGIARVTGFCEAWLQGYVNNLYASTPRVVELLEKSENNLTLECDELWSFCGNHENKQWVC